MAWEPPRKDGGAPIVGYVVERKDPKSNRWTKLNRDPFPGTEFTDDGVREGKEYEYRVLAVNKAGSGEPSAPTDIATAKPSKGED